MNALTIFNLDENFVEMITHIYLQTRRSRCEYAIEKWVKRRSPQLVLNLVVLIRTPPWLIYVWFVTSLVRLMRGGKIMIYIKSKHAVCGRDL